MRQKTVGEGQKLYEQDINQKDVKLYKQNEKPYEYYEKSERKLYKMHDKLYEQNEQDKYTVLGQEKCTNKT